MFSASHTLEYAYSAWAVAQWAKQLGKTDDYNRLKDLSKGWERIYDPSCNFVRPKRRMVRLSRTSIRCKYGADSKKVTLGNIHSMYRTTRRLGREVGADVFNHRLDSIFTVSRKLIFSGGTEVGAFAGLQTLYNQRKPTVLAHPLDVQRGRSSLAYAKMGTGDLE